MPYHCDPRGAFDLAVANAYFGGWIQADTSAIPRIPMAFPVEGTNGSASVVLEQEPKGSVAGQVYGSVDKSERAWLQALSVLSLDVDGSGFADVGDEDSVVKALQRRYEGLRPVLFHSPYEAAAAFVIGHRISIAQGRAIRKRLAAEHGEAIDTDVGLQHAFPTPEALLRIETFTGIAPAKWPRLHAVAQAALDGTLDRAALRAMPVADALTLLRTIPGLGPFFSQGVLIRGAGTVDVVSDDEVTKQAIQQAYQLDHLPDQAEVLSIAERWKPFRTWVSVLLHVSLRREGGGPTRTPGRSRTRSRAKP